MPTPTPTTPLGLVASTASQPNATLKVRAASRARSAQWLLEVSVFTLAAVFVVWSAVNAKRSQVGPLLAAVEATGTSQAVAFVAATNESTQEVVFEDVVEESDALLAPVEAAAEPVKPAFGLGSFTPEAGAVRYFDGRPIRPKKTIIMTVTGYSPDARSCGDSADGRTATNHSVWTNGMNLVAADPRLLPYGSLVSVPGYASSDVVPVLDCGGAIKGARLDLLYPSHEHALQWGVKRVKVTVWEYADKAK
ncbi:MAG: 3D domain-containing protein [Phycisphaerales bacterium]